MTAAGDATMSGDLYVSKPQVVEAVHWTGDNSDECYRFHCRSVRVAFGKLEVRAGQDGVQGWVPVPVGHWLVSKLGDRSDIWPVAPDYFAEKYDPLASDDTGTP